MTLDLTSGLKSNARLAAVTLTIVCAMLLSACGSGGSLPIGNSQPLPISSADFTAWASPALFVPAGELSVEFDLENCTTQGSPAEINEPKLHINADGDIHISGFLPGGTNRTELFRVNYKQANTEHQIGFDFSGDAAAIRVQINDFPSTSIDVARIDSEALNAVHFDVRTSPGSIVKTQCALKTLSEATLLRFELQRFDLLTPARLGANLLEGVTAMNLAGLKSTASSNTFTGGVVYWDGLNPSDLPPSQEVLTRRFLSLDSAGNLTASPHDEVPRTNSSFVTYALLQGSRNFYSEFINRSNAVGADPSVKSVNLTLTTPDGFRVDIDIRRIASFSGVAIQPFSD